LTIFYLAVQLFTRRSRTNHGASLHGEIEIVKIDARQEDISRNQFPRQQGPQEHGLSHATGSMDMENPFLGAGKRGFELL